MTTVVLNTTTRKVEVFSSARDFQARAYGHDSKSALEAATVPVGIPLLVLRGYAQAGDGGVAHYKRVASEPTHAGKIQSSDGAWWEIAETIYNVKQFGAKGDGATDDAPPINAALSAASSVGVGRVHIPRGTYLLNSDGLSVLNGTHLTGDGIGATILKRGASTAGLHVLRFTGVSNVSVRDLTIDGNKANNTNAGHGIRIEDVSEFYVGNVRILDPLSYGIGMGGDFSKKHGIIENIWIERSGTDGIDIKNKENANEGLTISNVVIIDPAIDDPGKPGIDIRGPVHLDNITVLFKTASNGGHGIRFRQTGDPGVNGIGGRHSTLNNFYVKAEPGLTVGGGVLAHESSIKVSNGVVTGMSSAVMVQADADYCTFEGISAEECTNGFEDQRKNNTWLCCTTHGNAALVGDGFRLNGCVRPRLIGCEAAGHSNGIIMFNGATKLVMVATRSMTNTIDWQAVSGAFHNIAPINYEAAIPINNGMGFTQAEIAETFNTVNFLRFQGGATSVGPGLIAGGTDTDIDLLLTPKGAGKVRLGIHSAISSEALSGFIEIKDKAGTVRKIAVVS